MQFSPLFLITLLSAGALALPDPSSTIFSNFPPTNETDPIPSSSPHLEKRSHYGWLSSYAPTDYTCKGGYGGPRPKVYNDCIKFSPLTDNVGINWGSWPIGFGGLDIYSDTNCKVFAGKAIMKPMFDSKEGPGSCVSVRRHGAKWGSVRNHDMSHN